MSNIKFNEASKRERFAFKQLCDLYSLFKNEGNYSVYMTPDDGMDKYDCLVQKYDDNMGVTKRLIIELKVRMVSQSILSNCKVDGWILEQKKFNSLKEIKKLDQDKNEMIYINFLPDRTLVWNLDKLEERGLLKWESREMNIATMDSRDKKKSKKICYLKEEWALPYKYTFDDFLFERDMKENDIARRRNNDTNNMGSTFTQLLNKIKPEDD